MTKAENEIPVLEMEDGSVYTAGVRVRVKSRHGTTGTGTVTRCLGWANVPPTICVQMDPDTQWSEEVQRGWPVDRERFTTLGLFGGEIKEILPQLH